ncbi:MAG: hypothetical protein Q8Q04_01015 [archaeon]|nr:hypothetical protein [archaeon]
MKKSKMNQQVSALILLLVLGMVILGVAKYYLWSFDQIMLSFLIEGFLCFALSVLFARFSKNKEVFWTDSSIGASIFLITVVVVWVLGRIYLAQFQ